MRFFKKETEDLIKKFLNHFCGNCSDARREYLEYTIKKAMDKYGYPKDPSKNLKSTKGLVRFFKNIDIYE